MVSVAKGRSSPLAWNTSAYSGICSKRRPRTPNETCRFHGPPFGFRPYRLPREPGGRSTCSSWRPSWPFFPWARAWACSACRCVSCLEIWPWPKDTPNPNPRGEIRFLKDRKHWRQWRAGLTENDGCQAAWAACFCASFLSAISWPWRALWSV